MLNYLVYVFLNATAPIAPAVRRKAVNFLCVAVSLVLYWAPIFSTLSIYQRKTQEVMWRHR